MKQVSSMLGCCGRGDVLVGFTGFVLLKMVGGEELLGLSSQA